MLNFRQTGRLLATLLLGTALTFAAGHAHAKAEHRRHHHARHAYFAVRRHVRGGVKLFGFPEHLPVVAPDLVAEAKRDLGRGNFTHLAVEWCGAAMGIWARMTNYFVPPGYLQARQWIHAGPRLSRPAIGAVAVWSHHVGIIAGMTPRGPLMVSGNFNHRVAFGIQRRGKFLGYIQPVKIHNIRGV